MADRSSARTQPPARWLRKPAPAHSVGFSCPNKSPRAPRKRQKLKVKSAVGRRRRATQVRAGACRPCALETAWPSGRSKTRTGRARQERCQTAQCPRTRSVEAVSTWFVKRSL
jgi:hypothetical protein